MKYWLKNLVFISVLFAPNATVSLQAQTFGDIRACFDLDIQDTIVWYQNHETKKDRWVADSKGYYSDLIYLVFKKENKIHFEKWQTANRIILLLTEDIGRTKYRYDSTKVIDYQDFHSIPKNSKQQINDKMINNFNDFRDKITNLSENPAISHEWKRFLRITIPTAIAASLYFYHNPSYDCKTINVPYFYQPITNTLEILACMVCLNEKKPKECIENTFGEFYLLSPVKEKMPATILFDRTCVYASKKFQKRFYSSILMALQQNLNRYPRFNDFINLTYFNLYPHKLLYNFDGNYPIINSFEVH